MTLSILLSFIGGLMLGWGVFDNWPLAIAGFFVIATSMIMSDEIDGIDRIDNHSQEVIKEYDE
jgi:hypothetical protein